LHSLAEVAELTSLSERFIWGLTDAGDLPSVRVGQRCLVRPADLHAWIDAGCPHPRWTAAQAAAKAARAAEPAKTKDRRDARGRRKRVS
jgi:excisionase family DNA binding protein